MNPKRILLILAGLLAFTVGLVTALHAQAPFQRLDVSSSACHATQSGDATR